MTYKPCDRIFAKVKGFPHWPARINVLPKDVAVPKGKHPIFFYGTHEVYFLAPKDICLYELWKHKYAVNKCRALFRKGLEEIENEPDILLYGKDANAEQFLSQFYKFQSSTASSKCPLTEELTSPVAPAKNSFSKGDAKTSGVFSRLKRSKLLVPGKRIVKPSETQLTAVSNRTKKLTVDNPNNAIQKSASHAKNGKVDTSFTCKASSRSRPSSITAALGRPMREPVMKPFRTGMPVVDDKGSNNEPDWHSSSTERKDVSHGCALIEATVSVKTLPSSTDDLNLKGLTKRVEKPKSITSETKRPLSSPSWAERSSTSSIDPDLRTNREHSIANEPSRSKRRRISLSSPTRIRQQPKGSSSSTNRSHLKVSNVSTTASGLNSRSNQQNDRKQLEELGIEARLHKIDIAIKTSLIRDQENIPICLQRLEALEKMELTLPMLVKCSVIVDTIRKCSRYKPSMEVRIAALKVFNRFLKIRELASREDMEDAYTKSLTANKSLPAVNAHTEPPSIAEIFQDTQPSQASTVKRKSVISPLKSFPSTELSSPMAPPPVALPPIPQLTTLPCDAASSSVAASQDQPSVATQDAPDSPSPPGAADSEGLAPSLNDIESAESLESFEDSLPSHLLNSTLKAFNTDATMAAVKQVFLQHAREKMAARTLSTPQSAPSPSAQLPPSAITLEAVSQFQHPCSDPPPTYVSSSAPPPAYTLSSSSCPPSFGVKSNRKLPFLMHEEGIPRMHHRPSPENRRRPGRERARSPHALPYPLEHYQRFLHNGKANVLPLQRQSPSSASSKAYACLATNDLDSRIAHLLEAAAPHPHQPQEFQPPSVLFPPPPPPPPLPLSQNLILSHRPQPLLPRIAAPVGYTSASPIANEADDGQ